MVTISCGVELSKTLKYLAVLSGILSVSCIGIWIWSIHNVLILANARQHLRIGLLKIIDEEIESLLDEYVPGPVGNKGHVSIVEKGNVFAPVFHGVLIMLGLLAGLIIAQIIHIFLAIWLFWAAKSLNYQGVKAWFSWTVFLSLFTVAAAITQSILVTFHGLSLSADGVLILFYSYALLVARKFQKKAQLSTMKSKEPRIICQRLREGARVVLIEIGGILV